MYVLRGISTMEILVYRFNVDILTYFMIPVCDHLLMSMHFIYLYKNHTLSHITQNTHPQNAYNVI